MVLDVSVDYRLNMSLQVYVHAQFIDTLIFNLLKKRYICVTKLIMFFSNKWMEHGLAGRTGVGVTSRVAVGHESVRDHVTIRFRPMAVICVLVHPRKHQRVTLVHVQVSRNDTPQ